LRAEIGDQHPFTQFEVDEMDRDDFIRTTENMCTFYGRDRLETGVEFKVAHNFSEFLEQVDNCGGEYYYVMENGVWYFGSTEGKFKGRLVKLSEALASEMEVS
jgi:hypothetical protein